MKKHFFILGMALFMLAAWSVQVVAQEPVKKKEKEKTEMAPMTKKAGHEKTANKACGKTIKEKEAAAANCNKTKADKSAVAYQCPMKCEGDKTYDKPGKCPKCGMELKKVGKKTDIHTP